MSKPLKELLEAYTFYAQPQQDNLNTLVQSDEMARRLLKLDDLHVVRQSDGRCCCGQVPCPERRTLDGEE